MKTLTTRDALSHDEAKAALLAGVAPCVMWLYSDALKTTWTRLPAWIDSDGDLVISHPADASRELLRASPYAEYFLPSEEDLRRWNAN